MNKFGLVHIKGEGQIAHPDDPLGFLGSDEKFLRQLQKYADWRGVEETKNESCSRPHLLRKLKKG